MYTSIHFYRLAVPSAEAFSIAKGCRPAESPEGQDEKKRYYSHLNDREVGEHQRESKLETLNNVA